MKARAFPLAAACLLAIASRTTAQDVDVQAESLRGLDGLQVIVEDLNNHTREGGLTTDALQTYLEMRLRQARISVLSKDEREQSERKPYLYLNVIAFQTATGGWVYHLSLEVRQFACIRGGMEGQEGLLALIGGCSTFTTWEAAGLSKTPDNLANSVRGILPEFMDELVNDYLAMNP